MKKLLSFLLMLTLVLTSIPSLHADPTHYVNVKVNGLTTVTLSEQDGVALSGVIYSGDINDLAKINVKSDNFDKDYAVPTASNTLSGQVGSATNFSLSLVGGEIKFSTGSIKNNFEITLVKKGAHSGKHQITINADANITSQPMHLVNSGETAIITISPKHGFRVNTLKIADSSSDVTLGKNDTQKTLKTMDIRREQTASGQTLVTLSNVTDDITITATSTDLSYNIYVPDTDYVSKSKNTNNSVEQNGSFSVEFNPASYTKITHIRISSNNHSVDLRPGESRSTSEFNVRTYLNSFDNTVVNIDDIKSDITVKAYTDDNYYRPDYPRYDGYGKISITNSNTSTNISKKERFGDIFTADIKVKANSKTYGIESIRLHSYQNEHLIINRFDNTFTLNGVSYSVDWSEENGYEVAKFNIEFQRFLTISSKAKKVENIKHQEQPQKPSTPDRPKTSISKDGPSVALKTAPSGFTTITSTQYTPIKKGDSVGITVKTTKKGQGIDIVRISSSLGTTTIKRNIEDFTFNGQTFKTYWSYDENKNEVLDFVIPLRADTTISSHGSDLKTLPYFKENSPNADSNKVAKTKKAYMRGYNNAVFGPNDSLTRAQAVELLVKAFYDPSEKTLDAHKNINSYKDLPKTAWYTRSINYAYTMGYLDVLLIDRNEFKPNDPITRAEMIALITAFSKTQIIISDNPFTDLHHGHWAYNYIVTANKLQWVNGYMGEIRPNEKLTRAQSAVMVNRVLQREMPSLNDIKLSFSDVTQDKWFYWDVMSAVTDLR